MIRWFCEKYTYKRKFMLQFAGKNALKKLMR